MNHAIRLTEDSWYLGASDRRLALFENAYPVARGVSYNAYLLMDEKTALMDTVDRAVAGVFFESLEATLQGRGLDYVVVSHMEPDHAATLCELLERHPETTAVMTAQAMKLVGQFFGAEWTHRCRAVADGETLRLGAHTLRFIAAPMVHWPEVMFSYDELDRTLYSADAFGTFGALGGNLYADELEFERDWLPDMRRYYANIVGKYGAQVQAVLKKAAALPIARICPLHGPIWRKNLRWLLDKHDRWSRWEPEENAVMVVYGSIYGGTQQAAEVMAAELARLGVRNVALYDVSTVHSSVLVGEAFRTKAWALLSATYNGGLFTPMEQLLRELELHGMRGRTVALVENGSWGPMAGKRMQESLGAMRDMRVLEPVVTLRSRPEESQREALHGLAAQLAEALKETPKQAAEIDPTALFSLSYGLYVLTAREGDKDNGCIVNTASQVADNPNRLMISVNKHNLTHDMVLNTGVFNLCVLNQETTMDEIRRFGFASGRDTDKWEGCESARSQNGVRYPIKAVSTVLGARVLESRDVGSHTMFICELTETIKLSSVPAVTYAEYHSRIKPKPEKKPKKGYICKICGYVYEGDPLPADFICPLCKHGAEAFEPIEIKDEPQKQTTKEEKGMKYVCDVCGYVYDGDTPFEQLPDDWTCPLCGVDKSQFSKAEE